MAVSPTNLVGAVLEFLLDAVNTGTILEKHQHAQVNTPILANRAESDFI